MTAEGAHVGGCNLRCHGDMHFLMPTPGLPDPGLVRGNWTGEDDTPQARQALAYREADSRLRALYVELSRLRKMWAESDRDGAVARAVAYQSVMGTVGHIIQSIERIADTPISSVSAS